MQLPAVPRQRGDPRPEHGSRPDLRQPDRDGQDLGNDWSYDRNAQVIFSNRNTTKDKNYKFDYVRARYFPAGAAHRPAAGRRTDPLTQQTPVPNDAYVDNLVRQLTARQDTEYDKVRAIYDYFSRENGFTYSLNHGRPAPPGRTSRRSCKNKVGFCQQYAAAMAWMVRAAGIPARVAFGFTRGGDRDGNTWTADQPQRARLDRGLLRRLRLGPVRRHPGGRRVGSSRSDWAPDIDRPEPGGQPSANAGVLRRGQLRGSPARPTARTATSTTPASPARRQRPATAGLDHRAAGSPASPPW